MTLVPLPAQSAGVPWPTLEWPRGDLPRPVVVAVRDLLDEMYRDVGTYGVTYATAVVHAGRVVASRYGGALPHRNERDEPVGPKTPLLSWSIAKSVLHAAVGTLVAAGDLALEARAPVPEWSASDDPRREITLEHLLTMRDGLAFVEDYVDARRSDVMEMLFGSGRADVGHFAAGRPLAHEPGAVFNYSSGTSNIVARIVARIVGTGPRYEAYLRRVLFDRLGMRSATVRCDGAGTFIGSSFVYATALDYARFGLLYLRDGRWDGTRILPPGWVDHGRRARSRDPVDDRRHGAHWWVVGDDLGSFWASGYEGQSILVCPGLDLVVVRFGRSDASTSTALLDWRRRVVDAWRPVATRSAASDARYGPQP